MNTSSNHISIRSYADDEAPLVGNVLHAIGDLGSTIVTVGFDTPVQAVELDKGMALAIVRALTSVARGLDGEAVKGDDVFSELTVQGLEPDGQENVPVVMTADFTPDQRQIEISFDKQILCFEISPEEALSMAHALEIAASTLAESEPAPPQVEPYMVLRCGGKGGRCCKPVFIPVSRFSDIGAMRAMLQEVGWAILDQQAGNLPLLDVACPACLLTYITGELQTRGRLSDSRTKAALADLGAHLPEEPNAEKWFAAFASQQERQDGEPVRVNLELRPFVHELEKAGKIEVEETPEHFLVTVLPVSAPDPVPNVPPAAEA